MKNNMDRIADLEKEVNWIKLKLKELGKFYGNHLNRLHNSPSKPNGNNG